MAIGDADRRLVPVAHTPAWRRPTIEQRLHSLGRQGGLGQGDRRDVTVQKIGDGYRVAVCGFRFQIEAQHAVDHLIVSPQKLLSMTKSGVVQHAGDHIIPDRPVPVPHSGSGLTPEHRTKHF